MCWPWASAMALRTEASAPGARPARTAETIRRRSTRRIWASIQTSTRRSRVDGSGAPPAPRIRSTRSSAVGPIPHSAPSPDSDTRSLPSVTLASSHPPCSGPTRWSAGMRTSRQEHLVEGVLARHVDERPDLDPGRIHGADEVADPHVLGGRRIGAGQQDPPLGDVRVARPHLLPVDDPVVAVTLGPGGERGQVRAGAGLGEQLAPEVLPAEQRPEPAVLLLLGAGVHEGWPRPSDADGVDRAPDAFPPQLLVDHELGQRIGIEPVRRGPVRRHVAGLGQLAAAGVRVLVEPVPHLAAAGVVVAGQAEVHARSVGSSPRFTHVGGAGGSTGSRLERPLEPAGVVGTVGAVGRWDGARHEQLELRRRLGDGGGRAARRDRRHPGRPQRRLGANSTAAPTASRSSCSTSNAVQQDKVAIYLYNAPEYLQATFAAVKVGLVPVNTNYRYGDDELSYLWENADAIAVVFHGAFTDRIEGILDRVPGVKGWLWVDDGSGPCPDWATPYEDAAKSAIGAGRAPWGRSGDDLYMLYTGGTTGMPKGVMWRQDDLFARLIDSARAPLPRRRRASRPCAPRSRPARAASPSCRPARSCTGPATSPPTRCWPRAGGSACSSRASTTRPSCSTPSSARRSTHSSSWATPSPARCWPRWTSTRGSGT